MEHPGEDPSTGEPVAAGRTAPASMIRSAPNPQPSASNTPDGMMSAAGGGRGGRGGGGRSALISDLVAQLKRGDITKAELFARLQQLQGSASATTSDAAGAEAGTPMETPLSNPTPLAGDAVMGQASGVSPASSGASAMAAGASAAEAAGFFSANDRQVCGSRCRTRGA